MNRILPPFPPVSGLGSGAGEGICGREVIGLQTGNTPPTAAFPLDGDALVDSASEGGAESEHTGIGSARNNTGPSAQHLDGGGSEGRSSPFDPFVYDLCSSISDNRTISGQLNGCDFFPNDFRREKRGSPFGLCVYVCRYRDPSATVWGKLKRSVGGVVRSSPYFLRVAVRLHKIYCEVFHIINEGAVTCSGRPRLGA